MTVAAAAAAAAVVGGDGGSGGGAPSSADAADAAPAQAATTTHQPAAITTAEQLHAATSCGYAARDAAPAVTSVAVRRAGLGCVPPALHALTRLTSLDLSGNRIVSVPHVVGEMPALRAVDLSGNAIGAVHRELFELPRLESLNLGANDLRRVPDALCGCTTLTRLNLYGNRQLAALPEGFGQLAGLRVLGLKGCGLTALPQSFTRLANLVELYLTDNQLTGLPDGFGQGLASLVKLQASYNPLRALPGDVSALQRLELFRLAVGALPRWPVALGGLPRLAWCSLGSNPAAAPVPPLPLPPRLPRVFQRDVRLGEKLGEGASGEVFLCEFQGRPAAVKIFVDGASPDGATADEIAITCANDHPSLTRALALVLRDGAGGSSDGNADAPADDAGADAAATQQQQQQQQQQVAACDVAGLVLELVEGRPLALKPTSEHLLRNKWPPGAAFAPRAAVRVLHGVAGALRHLHARRVAHGDLYSHNILYDGRTHTAVLCDFGASFVYADDGDGVGGGSGGGGSGGGGGASFWEAMEVRAFGLFARDVAARVTAAEGGEGGDGGEAAAAQRTAAALAAVADACLVDVPAARPAFADLEARLGALLLP